MSLDQLTSMTKTITENAEQALTLFCINRKPYFDTETMEKFNNTYAGHVFEFLRNQFSLSTVLALSRIWDGSRGNRFDPSRGS